VKTEILYGTHPALEAIRAGRRTVFEVFVTRTASPGRHRQVLTRAESSGIPVNNVKPSAMKSLTGADSHQGIAARVGPYPFSEIDELVDPPEPNRQPPFILLLDGILDPHNLGAIIRTALCADISGIVIPKDRSAYPTPAVSKVSAGAMEHIRLARVVNMVRTLETLKEKGLWVLGMDSTADPTVFSSDLTGPTAIVIGGEDKGIRRLVRVHCDQLITIPQSGAVSSLNASVAGAIVMYEALRQRSGVRCQVSGVPRHKR